MTTSDRLVEGLRAEPGRPFLRWLVGHLAETLDAPYAFAAELGGDDWEHIEMLASTGGTPLLAEGSRCEVADTPCHTVVFSAVAQTWAHDVARQFPHAAVLGALGIETYVGLGLADESGRPVGLIAVLDTRPRDDVARIAAALEEFRARAAGDLGLRRALRERDALIEGTLAASGDGVFGVLARAVSHALHVKLAFVSELLPESPHMARTLAICNGGVLDENITYDVRGTPCGHVYRHSLLIHPRNVQRLYPTDPYLVQQAAESYMGIAFHDAEDAPIGHIGVLHDHPLDERLLAQNVFRVFARMAGHELRRRRAEQERLAMERRLLDTQKMETLGMLAGGVAHDFNNMLVGIMGRAALGLGEPGLTPPVRSHLESIDLAAQRAADLTTHLLAYAGRTTSVARATNPSALLRETGTLLATSIPSNVDVRYELDPDPPSVDADPAQLRQVIMNLVLNAVDAIGTAPGRVTLRTLARTYDLAALRSTVDGRRLPPGDYVSMEVQDTGCGMDAETVGKMFDPFFTTKVAGHGLGLAAVRGIIRAHHGTMRVTSEPQGGTTFRLLLPAGPPVASTDGPDPLGAATSWKGSGLVLLVDDDEEVRVTTTSMLERLGFTVVPARGGREALGIFDAQGADIRAAVLDLAMPGMSGEETVAELRARRRDLPVVMMSGYDSARAAERLAGNQDIRFLQKPFRADTLRATIRDLLDTPSRTEAPPAPRAGDGVGRDVRPGAR